MRVSVLLPLVMAGCSIIGPLASGAELKFANAHESRSEYERTVVPFFSQYCQECHSLKRAEGELNLAALDPDMKSSTSGARWAMVVEQLSLGKMPPEERRRPEPASLAAVIIWAQAEAKRANKHFARRVAYANGNQVAHQLLFDPRHVGPLDSAPRVRSLSPEIYAGLLKDLSKNAIAGQPFSADAKTTFRDMEASKIDTPIATQLFDNALTIVEHQTSHKIEDGRAKPTSFAPKELIALFDPASPPTDKQIESALQFQFQTILKRSPSAIELDRFARLMRRNIEDAGQTIGVRYTLAAVLMLPEAVFRMEVGNGKPDEHGRVRLAPREIAFALAYAVTDRRPDAVLLTAAATGNLDSAEDVEKQICRLLDDPKLDKPRVLRFFREYFAYDKAIDVFKENKDNPDHDARVLVEDTDRLVQHILEQDRDVLRQLLTTNESFVAYRTAADSKKKRAEALAKFEEEKAKNPEKFRTKEPPRVGKSYFTSYGLDDFPDQQPVKLPERERAGILTQPAWLVAQSTSFDNHAIHRGKWIRERLLGGVVPDIPITVDAQLPIAPEQTLRERMSVTRQEYCWKCHQLMNDLGLPFEQFDHFGRLRRSEVVLDPVATAANVDKKGRPQGPVQHEVSLDTSGLVAHVGHVELEGEVAGAIELVKKLAESEYVEQVFVRHAFRFWLGRNESPGDAASLQAAHQAYRSSGGSMKALITALVTSESFLYRVRPTDRSSSNP